MSYFGENVIPEGFVIVVDVPDLLINRSGIVLRRDTLELVPHAYEIYVRAGQHQLHRLLALTFIPKPTDYHVPEGCSGELEVNHIDGNKHNFSLDNLEWVTRSENIIHAYRTGLRTQNKPILVKDLVTGEVQRYYSLWECARHFEVDGAVIHHHLKPCNRGKVSMEKYCFIYEGQEWPEVDVNLVFKYRNGTKRFVLAYDAVNPSVWAYFDTMGTFAKHIGLSPAAYSQHKKRNGPDKPFRGSVILHANPKDVGPNDFVFRSLKTWVRAKNKIPYPILVTDGLTGVTQRWDSTEAFAIEHDVEKQELQNSLWYKRGKWRHYTLEYLRNEISPVRE